jgi:propanol-preferring alcohol dehydrogenase
LADGGPDATRATGHHRSPAPQGQPAVLGTSVVVKHRGYGNRRGQAASKEALVADAHPDNRPDVRPADRADEHPDDPAGRRPDIRYVEVAPGTVSVRHGPVTPLAPGLARIRVEACGVCGTDLHLLHGMVLPAGASYPVRPGHEVCGVLIEVEPPEDASREGAPRTHPAVGDTVVLHPLAACGNCDHCTSGRDHLCPHARILGIEAPGGMADDVVWPLDRLVAVDGLPPAQAALLPDAVATAYHALRVAQVPAGGTLCVLGAGGIGTHVLQLAGVLDPAVTLAAVVRSEATAERVRQLGAEVVVGLDGSAKAVRAAIGPVDAVIDFSGAEAAPAVGLRMLGPGGRLVLGSIADAPLQLGMATTTVVMRELSVVGAYNATLGDLEAVAALAIDGRLDLAGSVSLVLPLDEAAAALDLLDHRPPGLVRLVLQP